MDARGTRRTRSAPDTTPLRDLTGRVCVVTGASSGIGRAAAVQLARLGATVGLVGRDPRRSAEVRDQLAAAVGVDRVELFLADLSAQREVRRLAARLQDRFPAIHALVHVAGVDVARRQVTEDGLELTFAVNHLAPFLLTRLLLPQLRRGAPARVVTVSSSAHHTGAIRFDDLQGERRFRGQRAYGQSKLANVLFTTELGRRFSPDELGAFAVDPGWVKGTNLGATASVGLKALGLLVLPFMVTPDRGADTVVWAASSPTLDGRTGLYLTKRTVEQPSHRAQDAQLADRLWAVSEVLAPAGPAPRPSSW
jgi:NAD(P)-dependent dehydrogenase (short-subunit alcohol dehydrogenase family)